MEFGPILRAMSRNKVRFGLVVLEIALTLAVVANCVNMIRNAKSELSIPSGFDDENLISVRTVPFDAAFRDKPFFDASVDRDMERLGRIPGVKAVTNMRLVPWQGGGSSDELHPIGAKETSYRTQIYNADGGTLKTLGTTLLEGRDFRPDEAATETLRMRKIFDDAEAAKGVKRDPTVQEILISKAYANLVWKDGRALGKMLEDTDGDHYRVVGVLDRFYNPYGWPIHEFVVLYAARSHSFDGGAPYLIRVEPGQMAAVQKAIEPALLEVNAGRGFRIRTVSDVKRRYQGSSTLLVNVLSGVIVLLLFVTALGILGLTSFSVTERTRQIGTRRALGAQKNDILLYFLVENGLVTGMGLILGAILTYGLNIALVSKASGTKLETGLVALGSLFLLVTGLLAALMPALRAARVAPAVATRNV